MTPGGARKVNIMDEQLYLMGLGLSLEEKVKRAIATFQMYEPEALRRDPEGFFVCDSYGKDSGVILRLAKTASVKFVAHHNLTTLDAPETIMFGRINHIRTVVHTPKIALLTRLAKEKTTLPTRKGRWCCEEYKEHGGLGLVKVTGVRAAESKRRKANWKIWQPDKKGEGWTLNPILYWSDKNIWEYTRNNNVPYCLLYDEGFDRLGCIGCPMSNHRKKEFLRWPRYETAWKRAIKKFYERIKGLPRNDGKPRYYERFNSWQELWQWWMEEMPKEDKGDECQMGLF